MKKYVKLMGNVVCALSILFVLSALARTDFDFAQVQDWRIFLAACATGVILKMGTVFLSASAWRLWLEFFAKKKCSRKEAFHVYAKANIGKYLPGNVMHYVGRNLFAQKLELSQKQVAAASISEVLSLMIAALLLGISMAFPQMQQALPAVAQKHPYVQKVVDALSFVGYSFGRFPAGQAGRFPAAVAGVALVVGFLAVAAGLAAICAARRHCKKSCGSAAGKLEKPDELHPSDKRNNLHPLDKKNKQNPSGKINNLHPLDKKNKRNPSGKINNLHPSDKKNKRNPSGKINNLHPSDKKNKRNPSGKINNLHPSDKKNKRNPSGKINNLHPLYKVREGAAGQENPGKYGIGSFFGTFLKSLAIYMTVLAILGLIFVFVYWYLYGMPTAGQALQMVASYTVAWALGFIIPGAPGGMGVREMVLTLLLGPLAGKDQVVVIGVLHRMITVVGDFFVYLWKGRRGE